jgi:hypothetical protein
VAAAPPAPVLVHYLRSCSDDATAAAAITKVTIIRRCWYCKTRLPHYRVRPPANQRDEEDRRPSLVVIIVSGLYPVVVVAAVSRELGVGLGVVRYYRRHYRSSPGATLSL